MATKSGQERPRKSSESPDREAAANRSPKRASSRTARSSAKDPTTRQADLAKKVDPALLLELYEEMLLIRRFEEKAGQMYGMGLIGGFCHLYIGQEAVVVGQIGRAARMARRSYPGATSS